MSVAVLAAAAVVGRHHLRMAVAAAAAGWMQVQAAAAGLRSTAARVRRTPGLPWRYPRRRPFFDPPVKSANQTKEVRS